ncbi:MAG: FHA domain-containing protein, partial [Planctomycetota bacterium]|nr:FHA domain-containing protein [Planctomycetota bacterium]
FESPVKKSSHPESSGSIPRLTSVMLASMAGPKKGVAGTTLFWLCSDQLEPVPLGTSYSLTVGRHESNDLVLPDNEVSRFHATFKVRGTTVNIEDLGSSNGVKINGERRAQHRLSVNDEIQMGPYIFRVESDQERPSRELKDSQSSAIPPNSYSGDLSEVSLREALRSLQLQQKTGTLTLLHGSMAGHITLLAGMIHSAELGVLLGKEAVETMMTYTEGHFIFRHEKPRGDTGLDLSVSDIIKEIDEQDFENTGALLPGSSGHDIQV